MKRKDLGKGHKKRKELTRCSLLRYVGNNVDYRLDSRDENVRDSSIGIKMRFS